MDFKVIMLLLLGVVAWTLYALMPPSFTEAQSLALGSDRLVTDREGQVIHVLRTDFKRRRLGWYAHDEFSPELVRAVLFSEDKRFWSHFGIDAMALLRATRAMVGGHRLQGASTLTMQVADLINPNVLLHHRPIPKRSLLHKLRQTITALLLEARWSKHQILEAYLNLIHLRGELEGVQTLSYAAFHKSPKVLELEESAVIAAMISSPQQTLTQLKKRACQLILQLSGSCERVERVATAALQKAPVLNHLPEELPHLARRLTRLSPSQAIIHSTIDSELQRFVQNTLDDQVRHLQGRNVHDGAAIVIDNLSGEVLAYIGAVSESANGHVDGITAARQAGSTLKPFIYTLGFDQRRLTPTSILLDEGTTISWAGGVYRPLNYDRAFNGPVSVREALGSSLNVPAVKALISVGLRQGYNLLKQLEFSNLREPDYYGVSMALGAVDVTLEDLTNAYRTLAQNGVWSSLQWHPGDEAHEHRVFSAEATYLTTSILSDPGARAIGFGWDSPMETAYWTAVKTGTSKDYRDNWCVGFSRRYTVGVWVGNFNAEPMREVSGISGAAPSWFEIMNHLHRDTPSRAPAPPEGIVTKTVRHSWRGHGHKEFFISGTEPNDEVIEIGHDKNLQFVFPAEGSVLVKNPKQDPRTIAIFVRYKGQGQKQMKLVYDETELGMARNPHKITDVRNGQHRLALVTLDGEELATVNFVVR